MKRVAASKGTVVLLLLLTSAHVSARSPCFRGRLVVREPAACAGFAETALQPPNEKPNDKPAQASLAPPAGHVLLFSFRAEGWQIYECRSKTDDAAAYEWALKAPDAVLFDDRGVKAGTHGAGPIWVANDGSEVTASKKAIVDAPDGRAVPWLLLKAQPHKGAGIFSNVSYIQRVDTWAGQSPAAGATKEDAGKTMSVKYQATYRFFGPMPQK